MAIYLQQYLVNAESSIYLGFREQRKELLARLVSKYSTRSGDVPVEVHGNTHNASIEKEARLGNCSEN